ncbi:MAG: hypothetical protein ACRC5C_02145, partial [Bacilli bacterium]
MTQSNVITYVMKEALKFPVEAEILDILTLQVEPIVTEVEEGDAITVRGDIIFHCEYMPKTEVDSNTILPERQVANIRTITTIAEVEPGRMEAEHTFPMEIVIPSNRVASVEDLDVRIVSVDWIVEANGLFYLNAIIEIEGVQSDVTREEDVERTEIEEEDAITAPTWTIDWDAVHERLQKQGVPG